MNVHTDAWVLHPGAQANGTSPPARGTLCRQDFTLPALADDEVLVEPLFVSWEANIDHALSRQPIDVCRARGEDPVILANLGVVRVLRSGSPAAAVKEGDLCLVMPFGKRDRHGYAELAYAYDAPHTTGLFAKRTQLPADLLIPIPEPTSYSLPQWAAIGRYFTAWDNWRVAHGCWLTQMAGQDPAGQLVFGWGGGVTFAELQLARRAGFRVAMTASTDRRLADLARNGIIGVDRRLLPDLCYAPAAARDDPGYRGRYRAAEAKFLGIIDELSDGTGVAIFVDNIGAPMYKATAKSLSRQGVLAACGWKQGMRIDTLRANDCINRHLYVHTHLWRYGDSPLIRDFQEKTGWIPEISSSAIYDFDEIPQLADDYAAGKIETYFPLFRVNPV